MAMVGVDVGGTFTDLVSVDHAGKLRVTKVLSTPDDSTRGVLQALRVDKTELGSVSLFVHATTLATNALIVRTSSSAGLITTKGFRDILELRRRDRASMYGLHTAFEPLVPRWLRLEVDERTDSAGRVLRAVDEAELAARARELLERGADAIAVAFLHSYANPENELRAKEVIQEIWPNEYVSVSHEILPEFREFERTAAVVTNAYLQPTMKRYVARLEPELRRVGLTAPLLIVQGNGSVMAAAAAGRRPVNAVLSGPAAGVAAARAIGASSGFEDVISCDMGGTSFDVSLVHGGELSYTHQRTPVFGLPLRIPAVDVVTIGAGGGSIARVDHGGFLRVGPESAGASPGPACYGRGGTLPTVTDANVALGRIGQASLSGDTSGLVLRRDLAVASLQGFMPGRTPEDAANAIIEVATNNMANAIRSVSVDRGLDPRTFALVVFGGAGPLHATALMRHLDGPKAVIPQYPGVTSAVGCLTADVRHDFVQSIDELVGTLDFGRIGELIQRHRELGEEFLAEANAALESVEVRTSLDVAYDGQTHAIVVPITADQLSPEVVKEAFRRRYGAEYFGRADASSGVRILALRSSVIGRRAGKAEVGRHKTGASLPTARPHIARSPVYFGDRFVETPVLERATLAAGYVVDGPALIVQSDTTTVIEPRARASVLSNGNLLLELEP